MLAQGGGPDVVKVGLRCEGVRREDHDAFAKATPWAAFMTSEAARERDRRNKRGR
jgi:hypothetical protein